MIGISPPQVDVDCSALPDRNCAAPIAARSRPAGPAQRCGKVEWIDGEFRVRPERGAVGYLPLLLKTAPG
jgi:hypothetical protein